jgi:hypothetical protein
LCDAGIATTSLAWGHKEVDFDFSTPKQNYRDNFTISGIKSTTIAVA